MVSVSAPGARWTVASNREACIGAGVCTSVVPRQFRIVDGASEPVAEVIEPDEEVLVAANLCPMSAILVTDATGAVLAPEED